jgi:ribonuclease VapC
MVIDSSPLAAILFHEPDASVYVSAILSDVTRLVSAATILETSMVVTDQLKGSSVKALDELVFKLRLVIVPVDYDQVVVAREAFRLYGKGRHPARLNFGDCFSYALAKVKGERLLFKGNDFSLTDIGRA